MFQTKVVEKIKIRFIISNIFLEDLTVYEIMWKNMVEQDRPPVTMLRRKDAICMLGN